MELKRNVSLASALRYKGQGPMLAFILHRIGGVGMALFIRGNLNRITHEYCHLY